jgi:hypothetical protein
MSWSECFKIRAVADHYRSIVLGLSCPLALVDASPLPRQSKSAALLPRALGSYAEYAQLVGGHAHFCGSIGPGVPNPQLFHDVFSHPIFATRVRRSLLWSAGNLKGGSQ